LYKIQRIWRCHWSGSSSIMKTRSCSLIEAAEICMTPRYPSWKRLLAVILFKGIP
jgi:hypothetical protein